MTVSDETLSAYADGMLSGEEAERVAAAIDADPALHERVARMRAATATLRAAFDSVIDEPIPERFTALLAAPGEKRGVVIAFPRRQERAFWAAAAAACLALAFMGGRMSTPSAPIVTADGRLAASGALVRALNTQASGAEGAIQITLSFAADTGDYCRVFRLSGKAPAEGLACGARDDWTIVALTEAASEREGYVQAASGTSHVILDLAAQRRAGDPLDADAERGAIRSGWRN